MKKLTITLCVVLVTALIFILSLNHFRWDYLQMASGKLPLILGYDSIPKSADAAHFILKYSQQIHPPVQCIPFNTVRGKIPICVHENPNEYITGIIRKTGNWEKGISQSLQNILAVNPDYAVVDIGANLGMYSLLAANLKRPALAIEAMGINIEKFHQSIVINHFEKLITLVTRPLSDKYETIQLTAGVSNLGMSRLLNWGQNMAGLDKDRYNTESKTTVLLDDLIDLMPRKKAVVVIDVEGNEGRIIRGGQKFFDSIHISHVFMEWNLLNRLDQQYLVAFFSKRNYKPYNSPSFTSELAVSKSASWPANIYWKKIDTK